MTEKELKRFWLKVRVAPGCWQWTAYRNRDGYGTFFSRSSSTLAHRVSYEHFVGGIPEGLVCDHLCR